MMLRLFAALPVPDFISERVEPLMKGVPGAKWRPRENFHITLAFFGEIDHALTEELDHELAEIRIAPFELQLKSAGHFGRNPPSSIWLGVAGGEALETLARRCARAARRAGVSMEKRNYTPHLTLAYLSGATDISRLQSFESRLGLYRSERFIADRFHLYSSWSRKTGRANSYEIEAEYPLQP
ncbi:MAG: RNA 2',3'-cyclic phosphodiesterase [Pseudomonadota bacterium]